VVGVTAALYETDKPGRCASDMTRQGTTTMFSDVQTRRATDGMLNITVWAATWCRSNDSRTETIARHRTFTQTARRSAGAICARQ